MSTFVLVHGAWHGAWAWDRLRPHLAAAGHRVVTPTLPGAAGEPGVGLHHQANHLHAMLVAQSEPVVLVGHSYGGLVVREAAARAPHTIRHLLLIDAWLGADGQSLFDLAPPAFRDFCASTATGTGLQRLVPPPPPGLFGVFDPMDSAWLKVRLRPQPWATFSEPTRLAAGIAGVPGSAILCDSPAYPFAELAAAAGYPTRRIDTGHDAMLTAPGELASAMQELLRDERPGATDARAPTA
ncbi:alpha/beta fold hydrolase [Micromonospora sp. NPDC126480]|uniref:alpha/beta fold hydrolase n=1 Tax=Micromonospora sp. NPDC126480 TaxID=3155312 RepID=UPI0033231E51